MTDLISQLNLDKLYAVRLKRITKQVKADKQKITNIADKYNNLYKHEISEGTERQKVLITDGFSRGYSKDEVIASSGFIPTIYTPVLNWLYFFMNEHKDVKKETTRQKLNEEVGHMTHEEVTVMEKTPELFEYLYGNITLGTFSKLKKLKALSRSNNKHEAYSAYRKCLDLCEEHNIDFDKIPLK